MARKLIEAGIEHLKQDGYSEVRLRVYAGNQAMKLYETFGFKQKTIIMSVNYPPLKA